MTDLGVVATKCGTDKGPRSHNYTSTYSEFFLPFRKIGGITILEIGVKDGASLRMWSEYFPNSKIIGIDVNPKCANLSGPFTVEVGSQDDYAFLGCICKKHGPFSIIIDDGSHISSHQIKSMLFLWSHLRPGGWYCIEDVHTSYMHRYGGGFGRYGSFIESSKRFIDSVNSKHWKGQAKFASAYDGQIERILFEDKLVMVKKK